MMMRTDGKINFEKILRKFFKLPQFIQKYEIFRQVKAGNKAR